MEKNPVCFSTDTDHTVKWAMAMNGKWLLLWDQEGEDLLVFVFCNQHSKKDVLRTV